MIQSKRGLLLVALFTVIVILIASFPARVAYRWASPSQLKLSGIHGSIWRGSADAGGATGIYLRDMSWRLRPLHLLTGKVSFAVKGSPVSGFAEGNVGIGIGGKVSISDLAASLPLYLFAKPLNVRGLQGNASAQFERIELRDGLPVAAKGTVQVNNLVAPLLSRDSIGGYQAEFFTQEDGITASVEDTDGVLDLAGSLQINPDRSFQFLGQVVAKPATPSNLRQQLEFLGPANNRGQRELRLEGSL